MHGFIVWEDFKQIQSKDLCQQYPLNSTHIDYAIQSWSPWLIKDKEVLEKFQKRAIRMVSNLKGRTYEERLVEANMTTLETRDNDRKG